MYIVRIIIKVKNSFLKVGILLFNMIFIKPNNLELYKSLLEYSIENLRLNSKAAVKNLPRKQSHIRTLAFYYVEF